MCSRQISTCERRRIDPSFSFCCWTKRRFSKTKTTRRKERWTFVVRLVKCSVRFCFSSERTRRFWSTNIIRTIVQRSWKTLRSISRVRRTKVEWIFREIFFSSTVSKPIHSSSAKKRLNKENIDDNSFEIRRKSADHEKFDTKCFFCFLRHFSI